MKKSLLILLFAAGALSIQSCNSNNKSADDTVEHAMEQNEEMADRQGTTGADMRTGDVSDFAVKAADSGLAEVSAGKVAQQKAQNQSVKDFAAMMIQDHTKSNEELKSIASSKNITLPTAPGENHQEKIADLNSLTGADFDKEYMGMMVDDHQKAVDLFEDAAENNEDPELKAFAAKNLPALQKHLEQAKALEESLQ